MQTSGLSRHERGRGVGDGADARGLVPQLPHQLDERLARPGLVLDDEDVHGRASPSPVLRRSGATREARRAGPRVRRAGGGLRRIRCTARARKSSSARSSPRGRWKSRSGFASPLPPRASIRRATRPGADSARSRGGAPPGSRDRRNHDQGPQGVDRGEAPQQEPGPGRRALLERNPGDAAEIADRGVLGRLARDAREARQEVDEPAGGGEVGLRRREPGPRGKNRSQEPSARRRSRSSSFTPAAESGSARACRSVPSASATPPGRSGGSASFICGVLYAKHRPARRERQ